MIVASVYYLYTHTHSRAGWLLCCHCSVSHQLLTRVQLAFISQSRNDLGTWFLRQTKEWSILTKNNSGYWVHPLTNLLYVTPLDSQLSTIAMYYQLPIHFPISIMDQYSKLVRLCLKGVKDWQASCTKVITHALAFHRSSISVSFRKMDKGGKIILRENLGGRSDYARQCSL